MARDTAEKIVRALAKEYGVTFQIDQRGHRWQECDMCQEDVHLCEVGDGTCIAGRARRLLAGRGKKK